MGDDDRASEVIKTAILVTLLALMVVSCADGAPSPPRTAFACRSEAECAYAYEQARLRAARCHAGARSGIQIIDAASRLGGCDQEDARVQVAGQRLVWFQAQVRLAAEAFAKQQQWAAQENARLQHEKAEAERQNEMRQRIEAQWLALDVKACSVRGEFAACDALSGFISAYPGNPHQAEAAELLRAGLDKAAELRAKDQEAIELKAANQKREDVARAQEAARIQAARAKEAAETKAKSAEIQARAAAKAACRSACKNKCGAILDQAGFQSCLQSCSAGCN